MQKSMLTTSVDHALMESFFKAQHFMTALTCIASIYAASISKWNSYREFATRKGTTFYPKYGKANAHKN